MLLLKIWWYRIICSWYKGKQTIHHYFLTKYSWQYQLSPITHWPQVKLMKEVESGGGSLSLLSHRFGNHYWFISCYRIMILDLCLICRLRQFISWKLITTHLPWTDHIFLSFLLKHTNKKCRYLQCAMWWIVTNWTNCMSSMQI